MLGWLVRKHTKRIHRLKNRIHRNRDAMHGELQAIGSVAKRKVPTPEGILTCFSLGMLVGFIKSSPHSSSSSKSKKSQPKTEQTQKKSQPPSWLAAGVILFQYLDKIMRISDMFSQPKDDKDDKDERKASTTGAAKEPSAGHYQPHPEQVPLD